MSTKLHFVQSGPVGKGLKLKHFKQLCRLEEFAGIRSRYTQLLSVAVQRVTPEDIISAPLSPVSKILRRHEAQMYFCRTSGNSTFHHAWIDPAKANQYSVTTWQTC